MPRKDYGDFSLECTGQYLEDLKNGHTLWFTGNVAKGEQWFDENAPGASCAVDKFTGGMQGWSEEHQPTKHGFSKGSGKIEAG